MRFLETDIPGAYVLELEHYVDERGSFAPYTPQAAAGVRWDDPAIGIDWPPVATRTISDRDRSWPDFRPDTSPS